MKTQKIIENRKEVNGIIDKEVKKSNRKRENTNKNPSVNNKNNSIFKQNQDHNRKSVSSDTSSTNNSLCEDVNESHINDKQGSQQQQKTGSQTISVNTTCTQMSSASSPQCDKKSQFSSSNDNNNECDRNESYNNNNNNNFNNNNNNLTNSSNNNNNNNNDERVIISPSRAQCKSPNYNDSNNNNNGNGSSKSTQSVYPLNIKGKPPLMKNMGSSSSCEGGNTSSGFISRDSSSEQFVDQNGIDLVQFFKETLNKNAKDRNMLMKIERDLSQLAVDQT